MVDSSISQVHLSSHGNCGQTSSSTIKSMGYVSVRHMPSSSRKYFFCLHIEEVSIDQINIKEKHPMVDSSISQVHQSSHGNLSNL